MGLLHDDDYVDPFKGHDYVTPGNSNAGNPSDQMSRDRLRHEMPRRSIPPQPSIPRPQPSIPRPQPFVTQTQSIMPTRAAKKTRMPVIISAIAIVAVIALAIIGSATGHGRFDSTANQVDPNTEKFTSLASQEMVSERSGNLYTYGGRALSVTIASVERGPKNLNGDATLKVTYDCRNISHRTFVPAAVIHPVVSQDGVELRDALSPKSDGGHNFYNTQIKPGGSARITDYHVLPDARTPIAVLAYNSRQKNLVRSAFSFSDDGKSLTRIDFADMPEAPKVDPATFEEDGRIERANGTILHFRVDALDRDQSDGKPVMVARISWYFEHISTYEGFSQYASVHATQQGEELDRKYLYNGEYTTKSALAEDGVLVSSTYVFALDDAKDAARLTVNNGENVLFEKVLDPSDTDSL